METFLKILFSCGCCGYLRVLVGNPFSGGMKTRKYQYLDVRRILEYNAKGGGTIKSVIIDGVTPSTCIFCCKFTTSIDFEMDLHLYENHRTELLRLPIGKGFSTDSRIKYAI